MFIWIYVYFFLDYVDPVIAITSPSIKSEIPSSLSCEICGQQFPGPIRLERHVKRIHPSSHAPPVKRPAVKQEQSGLTCPLCTERYLNDAEALKKHILSCDGKPPCLDLKETDDVNISINKYDLTTVEDMNIIFGNEDDQVSN